MEVEEFMGAIQSHFPEHTVFTFAWFGYLILSYKDFFFTLLALPTDPNVEA